MLTDYSSKSRTFLPLDSIVQPTVPTDLAAFYLSRRPQTLRKWACEDSGPIRPLRIYGRLAWRVADIKALVQVIGPHGRVQFDC
jgi:hypothetical protein